MGCSVLNTGVTGSPAMVNPGKICLALRTFCSPNICGRTLKEVSSSGGLSSPPTHFGEPSPGDGGKFGRIHQEGRRKQCLESAFSFPVGRVTFKLCLSLRASANPRENLSSGQEAQSTQKDDYRTQDYLCLPSHVVSISAPGGQAAQVL